MAVSCYKMSENAVALRPFVHSRTPFVSGCAY